MNIVGCKLVSERKLITLIYSENVVRYNGHEVFKRGGQGSLGSGL